jgi:hypothetical protein
LFVSLVALPVCATSIKVIGQKPNVKACAAMPAPDEWPMTLRAARETGFILTFVNHFFPFISCPLAFALIRPFLTPHVRFVRFAF